MFNATTCYPVYASLFVSGHLWELKMIENFKLSAKSGSGRL